MDFLHWEKSLSESERQVRDSVRAFVSQKIQPLIRTAFREEQFSPELPKLLGSLGVLGPTIPLIEREPASSLEYGLVMRELERCDSGLRSFASVQGALVMYPIHQFGSEEQKQNWLVPLSRGDSVGCFGLTEADGGSDPSNMKSHAEFRNGKWILNGSKYWITNGSIAQVAVVWAKTVNGIRGFVVPSTAPGFSAPKLTNKLSLRASVTSELVLDNVEIPEAAILPKSDGLRSALECLSQARFSIIWGVLGAAEACFEEALNFARNRILFGRRLDSFQLAQRKFSIMATKISLGQLMALQLAKLKDQNQLHFSQISMGKQYNVEMALEVARMARDVMGAAGIIDECSVMRHMANLESVFTYEGTNDIHQLIVGHALTGISSFS